MKKMKKNEKKNEKKLKSMKKIIKNRPTFPANLQKTWKT